MLVGALSSERGALVAYDIYLSGTTAAAFVAEQHGRNAAPLKADDSGIPGGMALI